MATGRVLSTVYLLPSIVTGYQSIGYWVLAIGNGPMSVPNSLIGPRTVPPGDNMGNSLAIRA